MKKIIYIIVALVILVGAYSFVSKKNVSDAKPIKIGVVISQTGIASAFGEMSKYGIDMAAQEINNNGGVDGRTVEIVYEDDHTDPKIAVSSYQKLTSIDKVDGIIGSNWDFVTQPLFALAKENGVVVISPSNPRIAGAFDTNDYSFVMMSDFSKIINGLENYVSGSSYKKMAVVHFKSEFGAEIAKNLKSINDKLGKSEIVDESYNQIGNNDFRTLIAKLKQSKVDLVFLDMVATDPITFVTQSKQLGFTPQFLTYDSIMDALAIEGTDKNLFDGVVVLNWNVVTKEFEQKFKDTYKKEPKNSVNRAYDAVYVLSEAISKSKDKSDISKILKSTEFKTPNGIFRFTPDHASSNTQIEVQIIKDGKLTKLK